MTGARASRTVVSRTPGFEYESTLGAPDPRLRDFVVGPYNGYRELSSRFVSRPELPSTIVPMVISLDLPVVTESQSQPGARDPHMAFVAGMQDGWVITEWTGRLTCIQVNLTPIGAHLLFGISMAEIANRVVALDDLPGSLGPAFADRLREAPDWDACFDALDDAFLARLAHIAAPAPAVDWAWRVLEEMDGRVSITRLAGELGISHRHLIAQFRQHVGLSPKRCARILRFNRALRMIDHEPTRSWADIVYDCGYNDQSHLIRDFHQFSGRTPTELASLRRQDFAL